MMRQQNENVFVSSTGSSTIGIDKAAIDKKRLLLVDDEETFLQTTASLLRMDDYEVLAFSDGYAAIEEIDRSPLDMAILDINMPGNRALELVEAVVDYDEYLPIILVTGEPSLETAIKSISFKINSYLLKPVPGELLLRPPGAVDKALGSVSANESLSAKRVTL